MDEICGFKEASTLSFVSMATLFCPQIKYPLWCFFRGQSDFFFFFFEICLVKGLTVFTGPCRYCLGLACSQLTTDSNVIWAHWLPTVCHSLKEDQFVPTTVKILCFSLLPTYRWGLTIFWLSSHVYRLTRFNFLVHRYTRFNFRICFLLQLDL